MTYLPPSFQVLLILPCVAAAAAAKSLQSCPTLCDPIDGSPLGSSVPGILQARTLEWVAIPSQCMKVKSESEVAQSCLTLSDPMDCSHQAPPSMGFFQARVLELGAIAFSTSLCYLTLILSSIQFLNFSVTVVFKEARQWLLCLCNLISFHRTWHT